MPCSWQTQSGTVWAPKDVQIWSYVVYLYFQLPKIQLMSAARWGCQSLNITGDSYPVVHWFLLTNPWYKLNAMKLLIIFLFSFQILWMCYLQLILFPPVLSERREAITGTFIKLGILFNCTYPELWKLAVWSSLWENNFYKDTLKWNEYLGEEEGRFLLLVATSLHGWNCNYL